MTQTEIALAKAKEAPKQESLVNQLMTPVMQSQLKMALPKHFTAERFARIVVTQLRKVPKLAQCTQASLWSCILDCAQLGLEPDGRKAHLIPYGDTCTLIVDYKGLVALARRSGEISDIHADIVCRNDKFEYSFGSDGKLEHRPNLEDRGEVIAAYSFAKLKDGSCSYEVMSVKEIDAIKQRSKAKTSGPWITDWNEMAKKTVFRRHSKWLPVSSEFQEAIDKDFDVPIDITPGKGSQVAPKEISRETAGLVAKPAIVEAPGVLSEEEKAEVLAAERARPKKQREPGED